MSAIPLRSDTPRIDVGALAASFAHDAAQLVASTLVGGFTSCEENDRPLNDLQKEALVKEALLNFGSLEPHAYLELAKTLENHGVETWGVSEEVAR